MYDARTRAYLSRCLADAFLAGVWTEPDLLARAATVFDRPPKWLRPVARATLAAYPRPPADRPRELARHIAQLVHERAPDEQPPPRVRRWLVPEPEMGRVRWPVPACASLAELAAFLELSDGELAWFADTQSRERTVPDEPLRHYRYATLPRAGGPVRVIERPKRRIKGLQRRILHEILDWIPAHDAAHGLSRSTHREEPSCAGRLPPSTGRHPSAEPPRRKAAGHKPATTSARRRSPCLPE